MAENMTSDGEPFTHRQLDSGTSVSPGTVMTQIARA